MKENEYSDCQILNEILDEEPTSPMRAIEDQLNTAASLGYSVSLPKKSWITRLLEEFEAVTVLEEDIHTECTELES